MFICFVSFFCALYCHNLFPFLFWKDLICISFSKFFKWIDYWVFLIGDYCFTILWWWLPHMDMNQPWVYLSYFQQYTNIYLRLSPQWAWSFLSPACFGISCFYYSGYWFLSFHCDFSSYLCLFRGLPECTCFWPEFLHSCKAQPWVTSWHPDGVACLTRAVEHPTASSRSKLAITHPARSCRPVLQGSPLDEWTPTFLVAKARKLAVLLDCSHTAWPDPVSPDQSECSGETQTPPA